MNKWTYFLFITIIFSSCSCEDGTRESWWVSDAMFMRSGDIVYTYNYEKIAYYTEGTVSGNVTKTRLKEYSTGLCSIDINGNNDRRIMDKAGDIKATSSNHIALCFGQASMSGYAYIKNDYNNLSILNTSGNLIKTMKAEEFLYKGFNTLENQWEQIDWQYYKHVKINWGETEIITHTKRISETNSKYGVFSFNINSQSTTPDKEYIPLNPLSTNFAQIPGYTNHKVDTSVIEQMTSTRIFFDQYWIAFTTNGNMPIREFCLLDNYTSPPTLTTFVNASNIKFDIYRYNSTRNAIRVYSGQNRSIYDVLTTTWQTKLISSVPTNFTVYDISPDHNYILTASGESKGTMELYNLNTKESRVLKDHRIKTEGDVSR